MFARDKILLRRYVNPKRVTLPDGRMFYVRCETLSRRNLFANVTLKRVRTTDPRIEQRHKCNNKAQVH